MSNNNDSIVHNSVTIIELVEAVQLLRFWLDHFTQGKKICFYKKQLTNKSASVSFGLIGLLH